MISILTIITLPGSNKTDGDVSSDISDWIVPFVQRHLKKKRLTSFILIDKKNNYFIINNHFSYCVD